MSPTRRRRPKPTPCVCAVVGSYAEACAALAAARAQGRGAVLVSPPGAADTLGVGYFHALVEEARAAVPGVAVEAVMDCGAAPGWALAALRAGFAAIVLDGDAPARRRVAAIARRRGVRLLLRPPAPRA